MFFSTISFNFQLKLLFQNTVNSKHADDGLFSRVSGDIFYIFIPSRFQFYAILKEQMENFLDSYPLPMQLIPDAAIIGGEALVRWIHPKLGFVTPDNFIPLLERTGLIYEVDKFIWEEACKLLTSLAAHGFPDFSISVNVARNDLYQEDLLDILLSLIRKYNLKPCQLKLEIIERAYATDSPTIRSDI